MTYLLTRSDVRQCLEVDELASALRKAFIADAQGDSTGAQRVGTPVGAGSAMVLVPGVAADIPAFTVKVHAKFPESDPAIRGVVLLFDDAAGNLLAILDSGYLTAVRTGVAAAAATDELARADASSVAVIGAGTQGRHVLRALHGFRPIDMVTVYDTDPSKTAAYVERMDTALDARLVPCGSLDEALKEAEIVLTATWATAPFLHAEQLRPGTHVTTLGADERGKCEVAREVLEVSRVIVDDVQLSVEAGAVGNVGLDASAIDAELGDVFLGTAGRTIDDDTTVYAPVGLPMQDCVAAWMTYRKALDIGAGTDIGMLH